MRAWILDFDGVIFKSGTMDFLPGAIETLKTFKKRGDQLLILTSRLDDQIGDNPLSVQKSAEVLAKAGIVCDMIIGNIRSPKILVNSDGAFAVQFPKDQGMSVEMLQTRAMFGVRLQEMWP